MKLFLSYLKKNAFVIAAYILTRAIIAVCLLLNGVEAVKFWYAFLLSGCVCLIIGLCRYVLYRSRHRQIELVLRDAQNGIDALPDTVDQIERDYQQMARGLSRQLKDEREQYDSRERDLRDYYTLWAHQIKTPIAAMKLSLNPGDDQLSRELFQIEQYVDMALNIARMQSDSSDYVIKRQAVDPIVRKAIRKYARLFIGKKLSVVYDGCDALINTDEKWLGFAIEQVLSNAVKYTSRGKITIKAGKDGIEVSDTGLGISPECLPRVFEKGFTGYAGRANEKSSGMGLYMVKTALKRLGHGITIESEPGLGTRVKILFYEETPVVE